jgi:hypothetical protein
MSSGLPALHSLGFALRGVGHASATWLSADDAPACLHESRCHSARPAHIGRVRRGPVWECRRSVLHGLPHRPSHCEAPRRTAKSVARITRAEARRKSGSRMRRYCGVCRRALTTRVCRPSPGTAARLAACGAAAAVSEAGTRSRRTDHGCSGFGPRRRGGKTSCVPADEILVAQVWVQRAEPQLLHGARGCAGQRERRSAAKASGGHPTQRCG